MPHMVATAPRPLPNAASDAGPAALVRRTRSPPHPSRDQTRQTLQSPEALHLPHMVASVPLPRQHGANDMGKSARWPHMVATAPLRRRNAANDAEPAAIVCRTRPTPRTPGDNTGQTTRRASADFSTDCGCRAEAHLRSCEGAGVRAAPLPDELPESFSVGAALQLGVSRRRLRAADLSSPFHGVRTGSAPPDDAFEASVRRRSTEYAARMRECEFFCLVAAAVVWGAPLPASVFRVRDAWNRRLERPLDVGVLLPSRASRARGVHGTSIAPGMGSVRTQPESGLRATSPATTWAMMGALLHRDDLIALGDAFVREPMRSGDPPALATIAELTAALEAGRRRGAATLREALPLVRTRSRSRKETQTRLALSGAGLPEPSLNWPVVVEGTTVAMVDLAYPERKLGFEYEGEQHLTDPRQWARDIRRYEMLADLGWRIVRVTATDLAQHRGEFVHRARAAFAGRARLD